MFRYLAGEEWQEHRAVMAVFAGTFFAEFSPADVLARLTAPGATAGAVAPTVWDTDIVQARLESLRGWGNLAVSSSVGNPSSLEEYYRRRNLYLITREGQEVHDLVEGVLNRIGEVRDMQTGRLRTIHRGLVALGRLVAADLDRATPADLADAVRLVFDAFSAFTDEITQFFASLNQWQSRYDLESDDLQFFAEILVSYVSEQLSEIERLARPISVILAELDADLDAVIARAGSGLAGRVDAAGLAARVSVQAPPGSRRSEWEHLGSWFRPTAGHRSRLDSLTGQAVLAVRTLTANLTRLSGGSLGSASRRADFVKLAGWVDRSAHSDEAHHLMAAAFGLGPSRHLGALAADDDDPVSTATPWALAPRAEVPVSIRRRGDTAMRGQPTKMRDRSTEKRVLQERRRREAEAQKRAAVELLASVDAEGRIDGATLSPAAFHRLQDLVGRSSHQGRARQPVRLVTDHELACEVEPRPGTDTTVETDDGRLRLIDVVVRLRPAPAAEPV